MEKVKLAPVNKKIKDTHRENTASNKTQALKKNLIMDIWVVGTSNQLLKGVLKLKQNFKKIEVTGKNPFFVTGLFCTPYSICLNIGFWHSSFV